MKIVNLNNNYLAQKKDKQAFGANIIADPEVFSNLSKIYTEAEVKFLTAKLTKLKIENSKDVLKNACEDVFEKKSLVKVLEPIGMDDFDLHMSYNEADRILALFGKSKSDAVSETFSVPIFLGIHTIIDTAKLVAKDLNFEGKLQALVNGASNGFQEFIKN